MDERINLNQNPAHPSEFILTSHDFKTGRTTCQFFATQGSAHDHGVTMQAMFPCDVYVSQVLSKKYGVR